ncbi:hypothetical protein [uncultured Sphingomonas sp.]|uniref:hypothetical protein n=1 Tax=uncultured Sphingomonas sp. TaxID=158754 RepID=UPI0035CB456B
MDYEHDGQGRPQLYRQEAVESYRYQLVGDTELARAPGAWLVLLCISLAAGLLAAIAMAS